MATLPESSRPVKSGIILIPEDFRVNQKLDTMKLSKDTQNLTCYTPDSNMARRLPLKYIL